jgi:hypothetical protein
MSKVFKFDETSTLTYEEQYAAWQLCADTILCDITTYPGNGEQQRSKPHFTKAITKRERRRHE